MNKIILNCTQGGARIEGAQQMLLKDAIEKYCIENIDKSKLKSLMTLADDGDRLIEDVIPLLENDIKTLKNISKNSRLGMATSKGLLNLINRTKGKLISKKTSKLFDKLAKEAFQEAGNNPLIGNDLFYDKVLKILKPKNKFLFPIIKLSKSNYMYSSAAHIDSRQNPLVNVAIYGASRQIQGRKLKVDETLGAFLNNKETANIRIERNNLILGTAKKVSESLCKSYEKTLEILKKYNETKDDTILRSKEIEKINLDDADKYFETGNWAHPLLDAKKLIKSDKKFINCSKTNEILKKTITMKHDAIKKAIEYEQENSERESKILTVNFLIEQSQRVGKEKKFEKALIFIKEALSIMPDNVNAQWGLASVLNQLKQYDESIEAYLKLIDMQGKEKPENPRFRFELGQVYLFNNQTKEGFEQISKAMELTNEFDSFLSHMGNIWFEKKEYEMALTNYNLYLEKFPLDYEIWKKKSDILYNLHRSDEAVEAHKKYEQIKYGKNND